MRAKKILGVLVAVLCVAVGPTAVAQVTIETVPVGNAGNAGELSGGSVPGGNGPDRVCGAVDYAYNIGKYEVTAGQYCEFLNAVAATDTYGLYNAGMDSSSYGCQITRNGSSGSYTYDFSGRPSGTEADWTDRPVDWVNWGDSARFANWLHNGQPTGAQDLTTTEDGAYFLDGATSIVALMAVSREANWTWALPSEDEWYKAAYHKNDGVTGNYYDYPTSSDSVPSNDLVEPTDPGNNGTFYDGTWPDSAGYTIGSPYFGTEVGAHENSDSPYGTFDQGGSVWEWNEAIPYTSNRGCRGGSFDVSAARLLASDRQNNSPTFEGDSVGFRVAFLPLLCGDADRDSDVDFDDFLALQVGWGCPPPPRTWADGDFNGDGCVDFDDFLTLQICWTGGAGASPIPEPATLSLLAVGALVLLRKRRK